MAEECLSSATRGDQTNEFDTPTKQHHHSPHFEAKQTKKQTKRSCDSFQNIIIHKWPTKHQSLIHSSPISNNQTSVGNTCSNHPSGTSLPASSPKTTCHVPLHSVASFWQLSSSSLPEIKVSNPTGSES